MKYFAAIIVSAALLLSFNSCTKCDRFGERAVERGIERAIERGSGGKVDLDVGRDVRIPAGFPNELIPPGGKAITKWSIREKSGAGDVIVFETRASLDRMVAYYEELAGWTVQTTMESTNGTVLMLESGSDKAVVTVAEGEGNKTMVNIVYTKQ